MKRLTKGWRGKKDIQRYVFLTVMLVVSLFNRDARLVPDLYRVLIDVYICYLFGYVLCWKHNDHYGQLDVSIAGTHPNHTRPSRTFHVFDFSNLVFSGLWGWKRRVHHTHSFGTPEFQRENRRQIVCVCVRVECGGEHGGKRRP